MVNFILGVLIGIIFDIAFNEIYKGCNALVEYLLNKEN